MEALIFRHTNPQQPPPLQRRSRAVVDTVHSVCSDTVCEHLDLSLPLSFFLFELLKIHLYFPTDTKTPSTFSPSTTLTPEGRPREWSASTYKHTNTQTCIRIDRQDRRQDRKQNTNDVYADLVVERLERNAWGGYFSMLLAHNH